MFDRFYRAPTARSLPGSGLGLAIVRMVAESHGGDVVAAERARAAVRCSRLRIPAVPMGEVEPDERPAAPARQPA